MINSIYDWNNDELMDGWAWNRLLEFGISSLRLGGAGVDGERQLRQQWDSAR